MGKRQASDTIDAIFCSLTITMKRAKLLPQLYTLLIGLSLFLSGCASHRVEPGVALEVSVSAPTANLEQGRSFNFVLELKNISQHEAQLTEIQLPAKLLKAFIYEGSLPAVTLTLAADGSGVLQPELTLAPGSSLELVFRFMALDPGHYVEQGLVVVDGVSFPFTLQAQVRGTNPAGWRPSLSTRPQTLVNAATPGQALVQIKALVEVEGEEQIGWNASGALISPDGLILTSARAVLGSRFYPVKDLIVALTVTPDAPPVEKYRASILQVDEELDVAVLKLRTDLSGMPLDYSSLQLPALAVASTVSAYLPGEPLDFWGYTADEEAMVSQLEGLVVGLQSAEQTGNQARILTSYQAKGEHFGWIATNSIGELVGIARPSGESANLSCQALLDSNRDGIVDDQDACVPAGGSLSELLPADAFANSLAAAYQGEIGFQRRQAEGIPYLPAGEVIAQDDFSPAAVRWHIFDDELGSAQIKDGQMVLWVNSPFSVVWSTVDYAYEAMSISATAQVLAGSGDGDFGLICGMLDGQHFTSLEVSEDGYFSIWKRSGSQTIILVDWSYAEIIAAGGALQLSAECSSESLKFAVNNSLLAEVIDPQFTPGTVGLMAGTLASSNLSVGFDNVEIRIP